MARQGKFARLPHALREQVNHRLLNGESAGTLLPWLNAQPDAARIWDLHFDGAPATPQNLSEWRGGGWKDWLADREKIENTKSLAEFAAKQAAAGGNLSEGLQAIFAGHLMEGFEVLIHAGEGPDQADDPVKRVATLGSVIAQLRNADTAAERTKLDKRKTGQKDEALKLAREKMEKQTVEAFLRYAATKEAQAIINSGAKKSVQMAELRKLIFG